MTLDDLITKLETLAEPSADIDAEIYSHLFGPQRSRWRNFIAVTQHPLRGVQYQSPTADLNTGRALIKAALPGWIWRVAECCVSDDAWVAPDYNDPTHGAKLFEIFPPEGHRDPVEFVGADVDRRPPGQPAIALCQSLMIGWEKWLEVKAAYDARMAN